ncbi:MAG: F-box-like domain-containing protein [Verrucomicrobia bacterium]|nr:F-box-like domain-containing protein [Verrucomicrobiota bacterium]
MAALTISTVSAATPPQVAQDAPLFSLPNEMLLRLFSQFSTQELVRISGTCKEIQDIAKDETLWQPLLSRHFPSAKKTEKQTHLQAYREQHLLHSNLTNGVYASSALAVDTDSYALAIAEGKLISGFEDHSIRIWDLETGLCERTLLGHEGLVSTLAVARGKLISGSDDNTIKIWDLKTGLCELTLSHTDPISSLAIAEDKLISGSFDTMISFWDLKTGALLQTLAGHADIVSSLAIAGDKLISGSFDTAINIWDLKTGALLQTLAGHTNWVNSLAISEGKLISGSSDTTIKIWNLETGFCERTLTGHTLGVTSLIIIEGMLVSGSVDGTVKIWDLETYECLNTLRGHTASVLSLAFAEGKLISGAMDKTFRFWDFNISDDDVFQQIADLLIDPNPQVAADAIGRFDRMPEKAKSAIYGELYHILKPLTNDYQGSAEHAFHDQNGQSSTPDQKALAIMNYLAKRTATAQSASKATDYANRNLSRG